MASSAPERAAIPPIYSPLRLLRRTPSSSTSPMTTNPSSPKQKRRTFFSIVYASVYTFLFLLLLVFLLVTPADAIRQAVEHNQYYNVIIIGVAYVATVLIVGFLYATRMFVTRNLLASIPREGSWGVGWCDGGGWSAGGGRGRGMRGSSAWGPGKGGRGGREGKGGGGPIEVKQEVADMIKVSLSRNAAIAWEAKPRVQEREPGSRGQLDSSGTAAAGDGQARLSRNGNGIWGANMPVGLRGALAPPSRDNPNTTRVGSEGTGLVGTDTHVQEEKQGPQKITQLNRLKKTVTLEEAMGTSLHPHHQVWGPISHPGWSSPNSPDLPNLQYSTVLSELPNLIEAKALTLAPTVRTDDGFGRDGDAELRATEAHAALQRQGEYMGLREYLSMLTQLGVLAPEPESEELVSEFLSRYETARFSTRPTTEEEFRSLMRLFASLLRAMRPLSSWGDISGGDGYGYNADGRMREEDNSDPDDPPAKSLSPSTPRSQRSIASLRSLRSWPSRVGRSFALHGHDGGNQSDADSYAGDMLQAQPGLAMHDSSSILTHGLGCGNAAVYRTAPTTPMSMAAKLAPLSPGYLGPGSSFAAGGADNDDSGSSFAQTRKVFDISTDDEQTAGANREGSLRQGFLSQQLDSHGQDNEINPQQHRTVRRGQPGLGAMGSGSLRSQRGEIASRGVGNGSGSRRSVSSGSGSGRSLRSARSAASIRTRGSGGSGRSEGSVIRLAKAGEGDLPYVLRLGQS